MGRQCVCARVRWQVHTSFKEGGVHERLQVLCFLLLVWIGISC